MKKLAIYTAIDGGHYVLKPQKFKSEDVDFFCFTNKNSNASPWKIRNIERRFKDKRLNYKWYKLMAHELFPDYEYSIWIDSLFVLHKDPRPYLKENLKDSNMAIFRHNTGRNCIYEEGQICADLKLANRNEVNLQLGRYRKDGYPEKNGLVMTGILLRRHNEPDVIKTMNHWFEEIKNGCKRDQVSFNYSVWKTNLNLKIIKELQHGNDCFVG